MNLQTLLRVYNYPSHNMFDVEAKIRTAVQNLLCAIQLLEIFLILPYREK